MGFIGEGVSLKWMKMSELILLDAEEPGFRLLLFYVHTPIADGQSPITI